MSAGYGEPRASSRAWRQCKANTTYISSWARALSVLDPSFIWPSICAQPRPEEVVKICKTLWNTALKQLPSEKLQEPFLADSEHGGPQGPQC